MVFKTTVKKNWCSHSLKTARSRLLGRRWSSLQLENRGGRSKSTFFKPFLSENLIYDIIAHASIWELKAGFSRRVHSRVNTIHSQFTCLFWKPLAGYKCSWSVIIQYCTVKIYCKWKHLLIKFSYSPFHSTFFPQTSPRRWREKKISFTSSELFGLISCHLRITS